MIGKAIGDHFVSSDHMRQLVGVEEAVERLFTEVEGGAPLGVGQESGDIGGRSGTARTGGSAADTGLTGSGWFRRHGLLIVAELLIGDRVVPQDLPRDGRLALGLLEWRWHRAR